MNKSQAAASLLIHKGGIFLYCSTILSTVARCPKLHELHIQFLRRSSRDKWEATSNGYIRVQPVDNLRTYNQIASDSKAEDAAE